MNVQLSGSLKCPHKLIPVEKVYVGKNAGYGGEGETVDLEEVVSKRWY